MRRGNRRRGVRFLGSIRGRRNGVRAAYGTSVQLQQPHRSLSQMRGIRQNSRHRRRFGDSRQGQDHIRRCRGLLARRDDEMVERPTGGERLQVRLPDTRALLQPHSRAEVAAVARQRAFPRAGRVFRLHRQRTTQDTVPRDEGALHGQDPLPRMRRHASAQGGPLRQGRRSEHRRAGRHDCGRTGGVLRYVATRRARRPHGATHIGGT